jgi:hypothetical protein
MKGDLHVRFRENAEVKFLCMTRFFSILHADNADNADFRRFIILKKICGNLRYLRASMNNSGYKVLCEYSAKIFCCGFREIVKFCIFAPN